MNPGVPLKKTTSWMFFLGVIPFRIPCLSHQQEKKTTWFDAQAKRETHTTHTKSIPKARSTGTKMKPSIHGHMPKLKRIIPCKSSLTVWPAEFHEGKHRNRPGETRPTFAKHPQQGPPILTRATGCIKGALGANRAFDRDHLLLAEPSLNPRNLALRNLTSEPGPPRTLSGLS